MEDKNKIGYFFKEHLSDYKEDISLMDMEMMSAQMAKSNFMKFNARTFNVYYAAAIVSGFLVTLTLGGHYIATYRKQSEILRKTQVEVTLLKDSLYSTKPDHHIDSAKPYFDDNNVSNVPSDPSIQSRKSNFIVKADGLVQPDAFKESNNGSSISKIDGATLVDHTVQNPVGKTERNQSGGDENANEGNAIDKSLELKELPAKKTVVIYKRDTIFEYDTLKVKKKRK